MSRSSVEEVVSLIDLVEHALAHSERSFDDPNAFPLRGILVVLQEIKSRVAAGVEPARELSGSYAPQGPAGAGMGNAGGANPAPAGGSVVSGQSSAGEMSSPAGHGAELPSPKRAEAAAPPAPKGGRGLAARIQMSPIGRGSSRADQVSGGGSVREISLSGDPNAGESQ